MRTINTVRIHLSEYNRRLQLKSQRHLVSKAEKCERIQQFQEGCTTCSGLRY